MRNRSAESGEGIYHWTLSGSYTVNVVAVFN